ncbi:helix-turn-helix domain-containing protein [Tenacibaculum mesophilum]|uniref:helix-turn-helix domain-containing protein n=1 Tax=Tenacibaculum mesophilum TaxID=104268 RepID=UPI00142FB939|nr:helix-turn-helix domain-containing protein [Tenacibaculum mesophilum]KAF9659981.1 helix-turn-helix domain-containing protein [Tenacibaculum mesophilum]
MANVLFYTHTKEDLVRAVRLVMNEIRQTELIDTLIPTDDEKLSQKAAARFLGVSVTTIIDWRKSGKIPRDAYIRIGRPIFYSKKKLIEYAKKDKSLVKV